MLERTPLKNTMLRPWIGIILFLAPVSVQGEPEVGMAFKSGVSISDLTRQPGAEGNPHHRYGYSGGLAGYAQWPLDRRFLLGGQLDLLYTQRGFDFFFEGARFARDRYHYLDITLVVRPEARFGVARIYALLGASWASLLKANGRSDNNGMVRDLTEFVRRYDVALVVGAGVALQIPYRELGPFRLDAIFLEARHDRGLINTDFENDANKNRSGSLMLGLSFALGSRPE